MPEPALVTRIRTHGGPSHDLLVLLDHHRVLTTNQLARATTTPERTVRYRLDRMREVGLVDCVRPGRETGSAPAHWWLRPAGARLVSGTALAEGRRAPSGLHVAHAAAIGEVWLALREHGPGAGVQLDDWWSDRAGWQEWDTSAGYPGRQRRLTPDAVAHLRLATDTVLGDAAAFIEVDLATMTQVLLREKLARYLDYAAARAWEGRHPHCPPLLLLTTTPTRAATFARAAAKLVDEQTDEDGLVVAACGLVRDPAPAVTEPVWKFPDPTEPERTLAELLAERITTAAAATARRTEQDAARRRDDRLWWLTRAAGHARLEPKLGDPVAAAALRHLAGPDPAALLDGDPALADQVLAWWGSSDGRGAGPAPAALVTTLRQRHHQLWTGQARALLAAAHPAADDPALAGLARQLAEGQLLSAAQMAELDQPPQRSRAQIQHDLLGGYPTWRARTVAARLAAMGRRERRHTDPAQLAAALDAEQLLACDTCALAYPRRDTDTTGELEDREPEDRHIAGDPCPYCRYGHLVEHDQAAAVPGLAQRLADLRARLH